MSWLRKDVDWLFSHGNYNNNLWLGSNTHMPNHKSDTLATEPLCSTYHRVKWGTNQSIPDVCGEKLRLQDIQHVEATDRDGTKQTRDEHILPPLMHKRQEKYRQPR